MVSRSFGQSDGQSVSQSVSCSVSWSASRSVGWSVGRLVGRLIDFRLQVSTTLLSFAGGFIKSSFTVYGLSTEEHTAYLISPVLDVQNKACLVSRFRTSGKFEITAHRKDKWGYDKSVILFT